MINSPQKTEISMRLIFGFLGALLLKDLFTNTSIIVDTFFIDGFNGEVFVFLMIVSAWIFRFIYGTAISLLYAQEIIVLPLAGRGKRNNLKVLCWRFFEFASFIIIFHIVGIIAGLAEKYNTKPQDVLSILLPALRNFTFDMLIFFGMWLLWRLTYNLLIYKIPSESKDYGPQNIISLSCTFILFSLYVVWIYSDPFFQTTQSIRYILLTLVFISLVYTLLEFCMPNKEQTNS